MHEGKHDPEYVSLVITTETIFILRILSHSLRQGSGRYPRQRRSRSNALRLYILVNINHAIVYKMLRIFRLRDTR